MAFKTLIFICAFQAQQLLTACQEKIDVSNTEGYELFLSQLKEGLKNTSHETAANHKVAKVSLSASKRCFQYFFVPAVKGVLPLALISFL